MRRVVLYIACSLDGYIARSDGRVDWLFTDQDYGFTDFLGSVDAVLLGRKTHDVMVELGERFVAGKKNYIFSRHPTAAHPPEVEYVAGDPRALVDRLRSAPGRDIWLVGGGDLLGQFLDADLVDDMIVFVHPIVLGEGIPLFPGTRRWVDLVLRRTQEFSSGLVELRYEVKHRNG